MSWICAIVLNHLGWCPGSTIHDIELRLANASSRLSSLRRLRGGVSIPVDITPCLSTGHGSLALDNRIGTESRLRRNAIHLTPLSESPTILAALFHIHKANGDHCRGTNGKEEWKAHPVVACVIDDGLDDIWPDDRGL